MFSNIDCRHGATIVMSYCTKGATIVMSYCTKLFDRSVIQVLLRYLTSQYDVTIVAPFPRLQNRGMVVHY